MLGLLSLVIIFTTVPIVLRLCIRIHRKIDAFVEGSLYLVDRERSRERADALTREMEVRSKYLEDKAKYLEDKALRENNRDPLRGNI